jgi:hypothetical protein
MCCSGAGFQRAGSNTLTTERPAHDDITSLNFDVIATPLDVADQIRSGLWIQKGDACHGVLNRHHRVEWVEVDDHLFGGVGTGGCCLAHDGNDRLAHKPNRVGRQQRTSHGLRPARVAERKGPDVEVSSRDDVDDAWHLRRSAHVDLGDAAMGKCRRNERHARSPGKIEVGDETRRSGEEPLVLSADDRRSEQRLRRSAGAIHMSRLPTDR